MASINLNWISENWFRKPNKPSNPPNFAFIGIKNLSIPKSEIIQNPNLTSSSINQPTDSNPPNEEQNPGIYSKMLDQFYWECDHRPDFRHTQEVDRILTEDPHFEKPENLTPEKIKEDLEWWEEFTNSPVIKFLRRAEEIADKMNEIELKQNENPYRWEDRKLWRALPHVPGPDGRPMPRKAIKTRRESDEKFWDFARQFFFGLWGFRQRPYPSSRPIDVAQAIGYKRLEKRYYDCELFVLNSVCDLDVVFVQCRNDEITENKGICNNGVNQLLDMITVFC